MYASARINISEIKAKIIANIVVDANGIDGMLIPNAIAITAPSEAPEDTPSVDPSARGFLSKPCIAAPQSDSEAPTRATQSTLGSLTEVIITGMEIVSGIGTPKTVSNIMTTVSLKGMLTLPMLTQSIRTVSAAAANSRYSQI